MEVLLDRRLGGIDRYYLGNINEALMLVPDEVRKCVVFLIYKNKFTKSDTLVGTAFFVSVKEEEFGLNFVYLVTAKHVIEAIEEKSLDKKVYIRINQKDKPSITLWSDLNKWKFHPSISEPTNKAMYIDVAVLEWHPNVEIYDCLFIPSTMAATADVISKEGIGCGDEVFITGLFSEHFGLQCNLPIIRIGNIACMPGEPVHTKKYGLIESYLVEARSIGGLSGSPVFLHLSGIRKGAWTLGREPIYWLGLMHGHFDLIDMEIGDTITEDNLYSLAINMGIAIVVPVSKILETLNQDEFVAARKQTSEAYKLKRAATPDVT
jgi:hypothetical protein